MRSAFIVIMLLGGAVVLLVGASPAVAADAGPVTAPPPAAPPAAAAPAVAPPKAATSPVFGKPQPSAQLRYNEGEALARAQAWPQAESAYAEATKLNPDFAEAWNGLGHARKMQRRYPEALAAYSQALRVRPDFPQALEYLGETYVAMGKLDDARSTLAKLKPLDAALADKLAHAIEGGAPASGW